MIFLKSINKSKNVSGRALKLVPLPGQFTEDTGEPVIEAYNVRGNLVPTALTTMFCPIANKPEWQKYPDGSVFVTEKLRLENMGTGSDYYCALSDIHFIGSPDPRMKDPLVPAHAATESELNAWKAWQANNGFASAANIQSGDGQNQPTLMERIRTEKKYAPPTIAQHGFSVEKAKWELIMRNIIRKVNTLMIGPTGTGKTALVKLACDILHLPLAVYDMGEIGKDCISGLCGVHSIGPDGSTYFDMSKFVEDIQHPGVVLLDELSRAPELNVLLPCLDDRRVLPLYMAGSTSVREVKIHPDCVFFATANLGSEFTGTFTPDAALMNRFMPLEIDYLDERQEKEVLMQREGIQEPQAAAIVRVCARVRTAYQNEEISRPVSTRESLAAARLVYDGYKPVEALETILLPLYEGTKATGERNIVATLIISQ